ncbi:MAG: HAD family phosphatase [Candidatus Micrarchaeota archaeon]
MIKAIIFDLDGVLVDATEWHYEALNKSLKLFGYEITRDEHLSTYNGLPTRKKLEMLSEQKNLPASLQKFINEMKQVYTMRIIENECVPSFDKLLMASRLKRDGYKLAVCSNAIRKSVVVMLEKTDLLKYMDLVLSNEDIKNPKPHPDIYLLAFEKLGVKPKEAVIVEDAPHGIASAKASGGHVCEVRGFDEVNYDRIADCLRRCV